MFNKILIANRGEIAVRIIRACKDLGIKTVAIFTEVDKDSMHVRQADEAVCISKPETPSAGYLSSSEIVVAAVKTQVQAIHPGYGFLSENADFAEIVGLLKMVFIGPKPETIRCMGDKIVALHTAAKAGVPIIPGSAGSIKNLADAIKTAYKIGFPLILKAAGGGGGKGMRIVRNEKELIENYEQAKNEAKTFFANPEIYMERYIQHARHIEVQVLSDTHGNVFILGDRDCSIQRRHQKLIEESPASHVSEKLREKMYSAARRLAKKVKYCGAGTIEFMVENNSEFYFMEMNTRVQVEHPVTEMVTGIDIVKQQILVAAGEKLMLTKKKIASRGHAIECRINAEDPHNNFMPSPGTIEKIILPGGPNVRVDTHAYTGYSIPPQYDSLVAKLIVHGEDRASTIQSMKRALNEFHIEGITTTIPLHEKIMENEEFVKGSYPTTFLDNTILKPLK